MNLRSVLKRLSNRCWKLTREYVRQRDNGKCQICGRRGRDVDHCFSRRISRLYFDSRNLTLLCRRCHFEKTYHIRGREKEVDDFVRRREGEEWWQWATGIAKNLKAHKRTISDLEQIEMEMREKLQESRS